MHVIFNDKNNGNKMEVQWVERITGSHKMKCKFDLAPSYGDQTSLEIKASLTRRKNSVNVS